MGDERLGDERLIPSRKVRAAWLALLGLLPLGLLHIVHQLDRPNTALDDYRIASMRIVASDSLRPPVEAEWQEIDAGAWMRTTVKRETFNSSWIAIDPPYGVPDDSGLAVYLPYPQANVAVYLGSRFVGAGGEMERPLPFYFRSLYFRLPVADPSVAPTEPIYLHLARESGFLNSNGVIVGPADLLADQYGSDRFLGVWLPAIVATLMLGLALSLLVLYVVSKREFAYFGLYGLIVVLWALHTIHGLIDRVPIDHWTWFALIYLLLWWVILTPPFANRFFDLGLRKLEIGVVGLGVVMTIPIIVFLATFDIAALYNYYALGWVPFILLCSLTTFLLYAYASWRHWSFESVGLYFLGAVGFTFGVRDHLFDFTTWVPGTTYYTKFVAMAQIAYINLVMARRHSKSARDLVELNLELEERVEDKARELEQGYEKRRELERDRTLSQERERLMRDMHDGLGGQLIQALAMSERENAPDELRESLEQALVDLRLIVDSIAPEQNDLVSLLASFRHRSKRVWEKSGVQLHWNMTDMAPASLGPERSLNVLRIVQEASTNALRHSGAENVSISAKPVDGEVCVEIVDDGAGFDPDAARSGFGLTNMRRRAEEANLELTIESDDAGTRVMLCIPV